MSADRPTEGGIGVPQAGSAVAATPSGEPVLELRGIVKRFGSVDALRGADFVLTAGEVHGLLGENGAGKSTLMHVAFGLVRPDAGEVRIGGTAVRVRSPLDAKALGVGMVHQHFTSIPTLTVAENLRLAGRRTAPPTALEQRLGQGLELSALVETLTVAQKQRLEILQALATGARVLLLDEPTAVLAPAETDDLLRELRAFARSGGSVVLITHKLGEVFAGADRVTVLRRGAVVLAGRRPGDETAGSLATAMIGQAPATRAPVARAAQSDPPGPLVAQAPGLTVRGGELVGIAAVEGNGQRPLLRALAGLEPRPAGMEVHGAVAFVPEDRTTEGLIPSFSLVENMVLGLPSRGPWVQGPWVRWAQARARTAALLEDFGIRASGPDAPARTLSGGNQQKVIFARAVERMPALVVAENPTRGLDLQAALFVHDRLRALAAAGMGVLFYSTDLDEVLALGTRVVVMHRGTVREAPADADKAMIGAMMLGVAP